MIGKGGYGLKKVARKHRQTKRLTKDEKRVKPRGLGKARKKDIIQPPNLNLGRSYE